MQNVKAVIGFVFGFGVLIYALAWVSVSACLINPAVSIADCRGNMAGEVVYQSVLAINAF